SRISISTCISWGRPDIALHKIRYRKNSETSGGAVIGIDDEDDSTFTITVDQKMFHFQAVRLTIHYAACPALTTTTTTTISEPSTWL
uniref:Uncharacterized protein n=1 Tax=Romanomermis culicivorax TaxID=13658 RepID=A0A915KFF0_ROMCU